ncbi:MAG TPA: DUF4132 domain-containing protein [Thermoanaerobaculia bacterium]|nr:DUF4132 domain-containing protein [Thermoanaerobaculia bacterium]
MSPFLDFVRRLLGQTATPAPVPSAPATVAPAPPFFSLIDQLVREVRPTVPEHNYFQQAEVHPFPTWQEIVQLDRADQTDLALEVLRRILDDLTQEALRRRTRSPFEFSGDIRRRRVLVSLLSALLRRTLSFDRARILALAEAAGRLQGHLWQVPPTPFFGAFEDYVGKGRIDDELRTALQPFAEALRGMTDGADRRKLLQRLENLFGDNPADDDRFLPYSGEAWTDFLLARFQALPRAVTLLWRDLLRHLRTATTAKPSEKWLRTAVERVNHAGVEDFRSIAAGVLSRIGQPRSRPALTDSRAAAEPTLIGEADADLLRGLIWAAGRVADRELVAALGQAADVCFKKIEGIGPRSPKIGNACLQALSHAPDPTAIAQISRLKTRARHASTRKQVEQAIGDAARRQGVTAEELEERGVPDFGMQEVGIRRQTLGDFTAEILANGPGDVTLHWLRADGSPQKSVPATVRAEHAAEIKALQRVVKEIDGIFAGQRDRIERLYLASRDWDLAAWRELYLNHPLVGALARRLIWRFGEDRLGIWHDGEIVDAAGTPLAGLDDTARVALWHPLESPAQTVRAWRDRLERNQITQPFKQAHREIYILTDAELRTETYSNRFAAHILKQHQFAALCQQRGWRYTLQGQWDSHNIPHRLLPEHGLRVELWAEPDFEGEASDMGIFLYISTDQVRFCDLAGTPQRLDQIPARLFSELMRDVDLFVGVASVGNDPSWMDGGDRPGSAYWHEYSFGAITASAQIRHDVLERLVPRLKIASRCALTDRFLVVRGDLRTYRIHLGSGNILMEPNDQYLCIVRDYSQPSRNAEKMVLPFEGDTTLSLILSKAFLLADDTGITDTTILRQIRS